MRKQSIFTPGVEVTTKDGVGVLVQVKPGNFRKQDYQVRFPNGQTRWYTLTDLQKAYRLAA